jgi:hypothetical protein
MKKRLLIGCIVASSALVATLVAANASAFHLLGNGSQEPPGISAGVSALSKLRPPATLPGDVAAYVDHAAAITGTGRAAAVASVRLLRSRLGEEKSDLYALRVANGSVCFILTGNAGLCPESKSVGDPGIQWVVAGGMPGKSNPAIVGIVGDNVSSVTLTADGVSRTLPVINNAVFGEIPELTTDPTAEITLRLSYSDGNTAAVAVTPPSSSG